MADTVNKDGLCTIKVATPYDGSLETLGKSRNGVEPDLEPYFDDVPGDENGGDNGPPIEIQYFGEIARVRLELTKFDTAVAAKISARIPSATAGTPGAVGTLLFAEEEYFRLLLHTPTRPMNFTRAIPRGAVTANKGTKWQTFTCEFECHKDANGVLYNTTTS